MVVIDGDLGALFTDRLPIDGVSISVTGLGGDHSVVSSSGGVSTALEQLQFDLGEGPHWDALHDASAVLVGDLRDVDSARWPAFSSQVRAIDVRALFSLPLMMGAAVIGVADLHRCLPGELSTVDLTNALTIAASVSVPAARAAIAAADRSAPSARANEPELRREVHQATGMLVVQLDATASDAFAVLRAHAYSHSMTINALASEIVSGRVDLTEYPVRS